MARSGEIRNMTGISAPYKDPLDPNLIIETDCAPLEECAAKIIGFLEDKEIIYINEQKKDILRSRANETLDGR